MDKNTQNKSPKGEYLQILLEPIGSLTESTVLTLNEDKLKKLGLDNRLIAGVTWTYNESPISYGIFNEDQTRTMLSLIKTILNASIVNAEQRKAVEHLIEEVIRQRQFEMANWAFRRTQEVYADGEKQAGDNGILISTKSY